MIMVKTTKAQRRAILRVYLRDGSHRGMTYREYRQTACATVGCDGAVVIPFAGMWLCIERDGYTHS